MSLDRKDIYQFLKSSAVGDDPAGTQNPSRLPGDPSFLLPGLIKRKLSTGSREVQTPASPARPTANSDSSVFPDIAPTPPHTPPALLRASLTANKEMGQYLGSDSQAVRKE